MRLEPLHRLALEFEYARELKDGEKLPRDGVLARLDMPENPPREPATLWREKLPLMCELLP
jgi:hypothetical protein